MTTNLKSSLSEMVLQIVPDTRPAMGNYVLDPMNMTICTHCCCTVTQLYSTLCNPIDCSTLGFPVLHHLPEPAQNHVH